MTDRIEKIVRKWGFEPMPDGKREVVEEQYFRIYRGIKFFIAVFNDSYSPYTKVQLDCVAKSEDSNVVSMRFDIGQRQYRKHDEKHIEFILKDNIKKFLDEFFVYDLFHDKEWKDGN